MSRSLVLNASYEPLSVVSSRRAVVLVLNGRAVALEERSERWQAESLSIAVPLVVKLTRYVKVPFRRVVPVTRRGVFGRDGHRCQYCGRPAESIDHVVPRSRGGQHVWDNVVACCRRCNVHKANRLPDEAGLCLARPPSAPARFGWIYASAGFSMEPAWARYLSSGV